MAEVDDRVEDGKGGIKAGVVGGKNHIYIPLINIYTYRVIFSKGFHPHPYSRIFYASSSIF